MADFLAMFLAYISLFAPRVNYLSANPTHVPPPINKAH